MSGGAGTSQATFTVTAAAGAVQSVALAKPGSYITQPTNPAPTTAVTGTGTDCTLTVQYK